VKTAQKHHWREQFGARVAAVISNKADAQGLVFAREQGIATAVSTTRRLPTAKLLMPS